MTDPTPPEQSLAASAFLSSFLAEQACAVSCRADGHVTGMVGHDLLDLNSEETGEAANIFLDCPIFVGIEEDVAEVMDLGGQMTLPSIVIDPSGSETSLDVRVVPHGDAEFMVLATRIDLNGQVHFRRLREARAEQYSSELAELERSRFRQFYRSNPVIAFAIDSDSTVLGASDEAVQFACGTSDGDIAGWARDFLSLQAPDVNAQGNTLVRDRSHELTSAVRADGAIRIIDLSIHSLSNPVTAKLEHYFALRDVTKQETTLRVLVRQGIERDALAEKLAKSNARLEGFARIAAHDIVAPIGRMAQFSQLLDARLRDVLDDEDALFYLEAIMESAQICTNVVRDILDLAKLDAVDAQTAQCQLASLVREIATGVAAEADLSLNDHLVLHEPMPQIIADPRLLSVILRNVLGNAWKYRAPDRDLRVDVKLERTKPRHMASLTIADNGLGFEPGDKSPFEPFARMSSAGQVPGTGLGLTAVRSAADSLGWSVAIESEPDVGTRLILSGIELV